MAIPDRLLMGPGPSNPYPSVYEALGRPLLGHMDPEFFELLDETNARLRTVFGTDNRLTIPLSGTGSAGMEASFVNFVEPGDVVVVGVNGVFGQRMCEVARRCGADVVRVDFEWGQPVDPDLLLAAHDSPAMIAMVHAETSTGAESPVPPVGAGKRDALLLVDCVTSVGGIPVAIDDWGVDIAYAGTQKCLGVPPGLAPITVSERAVERMVDLCPSWYLDLSMISEYAVGGRTYHHTAPTGMIAGLHAGLGTILEEGLDKGHERHSECGQALQEGLQSLGFGLFAAEGHRLPQLTSVVLPENLPDEAALRRRLLTEHGIEVGGGLGPVAGKVWRVGCMGHTARRENVERLLDALSGLL